MKAETIEEQLLWYLVLGLTVPVLVVVIPILLPFVAFGRLADWLIDRVIRGGDG